MTAPCPICGAWLEVRGALILCNEQSITSCPYCLAPLAVHNGAIVLDVATEPSEYIVKVTG
jgi:hypothetical protein